MKSFLSLTLSLLMFVPWVEAQEKPYRVALIVPLSGPIASLGEYVRRGAILGYETLEPEMKKKIELIVEDDQFDPKQTLSVYQRLSAGNAPPDAIFVIGSPTALAISPLTERRKCLLVAVGGSDPNIVKDRKYAFTHWVIPAMLGDVLSEEIARRGFERIGFVTAEVTGTLADTNATIDALKRRGLESRIVFKESFEKANTDFRAAVTTLKAKNADLVVMSLFPGGLSSFAKQARAIGLKAELAGIETLEDEAEVKAADGALLRAWYANASDPSKEFMAEYRGRWSEHPGWATANGFDSMKILAAALRTHGNDPDKIRDYWYSLKDYKGAAGTYSASGDNRFLLPAALKRITKDGFVPLAAPSK